MKNLTKKEYTRMVLYFVAVATPIIFVDNLVFDIVWFLLSYSLAWVAESE